MINRENIQTAYNDREGDWPAPWAAWYSGSDEWVYGSSEKQAIDNLKKELEE